MKAYLCGYHQIMTPQLIKVSRFHVTKQGSLSLGGSVLDTPVLVSLSPLL